MTRLIRGEKDSNAKGTSCKTGSFSNLFFYPRGFNETDINSDEATPVPNPNTAVKGSIAEGSAGLARARVGRRRLFFAFPKGKKDSLTL